MGRKFVNGIDVMGQPASRPVNGILLDAAGAAQYRHAVLEFERFIRELVCERARKEGREITPAYIDECVRRATSSVLPRITYVRQVLGLAKIPAVVARARTLLTQEEQVVVVAHHREVIDRLCAALGAARLQGGMSAAAMEETKRQFNHRETMILVLSLEVGKTGHTLCEQRLHRSGPECRHLLIAEEGWVPGDDDQVQDRLWRIGQTRDVLVEHLTALDTMDEGIWELREAKRRVVAAVTDGTPEPPEEAHVTSSLTRHLLGSRLLF